jgi:hypothetical protein
MIIPYAYAIDRSYRLIISIISKPKAKSARLAGSGTRMLNRFVGVMLLNAKENGFPSYILMSASLRSLRLVVLIVPKVLAVYTAFHGYDKRTA